MVIEEGDDVIEAADDVGAGVAVGDDLSE